MIRGDDSKAIAEKRDDVTPLVRGLWNSVKKHYRLTFSRGKVVDDAFAQIGVLADNFSHVVLAGRSYWVVTAESS